jgi:hypothetical protein
VFPIARSGPNPEPLEFSPHYHTVFSVFFLHKICLRSEVRKLSSIYFYVFLNLVFLWDRSHKSWDPIFLHFVHMLIQFNWSFYVLFINGTAYLTMLSVTQMSNDRMINKWVGNDVEGNGYGLII